MMRWRLTVFFLVVAIAILPACTTGDVDRSVDGYDQLKGQVKLGDSRQQVLSLLEPAQADLDARWKKVPDQYFDGNSTVEVYYFRSSYQTDGLITDDQYTPYIFRDGILVGIGWAMLRGSMAEAEIESTTAAGNLVFNPYTTSGQATATPDANAANYPRNFILYGFHSVSCLSWAQARANSNADALTYQAWVTGFISGAGWKGAGIKQTDYAAINYYLDGYCKRRPMDDLFTATRALIAKLKIRNR